MDAARRQREEYRQAASGTGGGHTALTERPLADADPDDFEGNFEVTVSLFTVCLSRN